MFSLIFVALGVALIVRGAWDGLWPLSLQLVAGLLLVIMGLLRWRFS
jgi:hypothetical protein